MLLCTGIPAACYHAGSMKKLFYLGLAQLNASQEFWHSWRSFHPETSRY